MRLITTLILAGALVALGCAKPGPSDQALATADFAVKQARDQGADQVASALMRSAEEKLGRARGLHKKKKYDESERLAQQVAVEAQLADAITRNKIAKDHLARAQQALPPATGVGSMGEIR